MSETSKGDGWWQASDMKWYPPQDHDGGSGGARRWVLPTVLVVVVGLLAAGVTFVVAGGDKAAAASVALEPVASVGADPFTDEVPVNEVADFPETVSAVIDDTVANLATDEATGTLVAAGGTPGLYGGTRDTSACDVAALTEFLTDPANAAKAKAWAGAEGVAVGDIATFVGELAPTVLTLDTRVTNHGFRNGEATPRQSVLEAGSAVLVDALGVPRVKCSCGNPLAEPEELDLATATLTGTQWATYSPGRTAIAQPAPDPQKSLTLLDTTTADTYQAPVGQNATWVATGSAQPEAGDAVGDAGIWTSDDGTTWEQTLDKPGSVNAVAHGDGMFVAVGGAGDGGIVYTSADGRDWTDAATMDAGLVDVAHGDGQWVAISGGKAWTSPDGTTWTEQPPFVFEYEETYADSIAFGDGQFLMDVSNCGASRCFAYQRWQSTDGVSWTQEPGDEDAVPEYGGASLAFSGTFGSVGVDSDGIPPGGAMVDERAVPAAALLEGGSWRSVAMHPADLFVSGLTGTGKGWLAVGGQGAGSSSDGVWTSPDLSSWTRIATIDARLSDVAVSGEPVVPSPASGEPEEPAPTGEIDFSSPLLAGYGEAQAMSSEGDGPARLARDVAALSDATGIQWTEEMVVALAASECNDWVHTAQNAQTEGSDLTPEGRKAWAEAIVPVLGIPLEAAEIATSGNPRRETFPPCG